MSASAPTRPLARMPMPSREEFYATIGATETPVILTGSMDTWPAASKWTFDHFKEVHGDITVPIEWLRYASKDSDRVERVGKVKQMKLREFVTELCSERAADGGYLIGRDIFRLIPSLLDDLRFPRYQSQDRMIEQLFFMGARGAFTQLHYDRAHNLHAMLAGRKRWQIYAPHKSSRLSPAKLEMPWSVMSRFDLVPDGGNPDVLPNGVEPDHDFVLGAGEILFLPYGWWHRVITLEPSIATNFWWWTWSMLPRFGPHVIPSAVVGAIKGVFRKKPAEGAGRRYRET